MPQFEVTFSLGNRNQSGTFMGESTMQYQKVTVTATSATNAQRQVEAMYGGRDRCLVGSAWEVRK